MSSKASWAICCSLLSLFGFFFLAAVGVLVQVQPEYMKLGKNVKSSTPLFESACLYGTIFLVSTTVWYLENKKEHGSDGAHRYHLVPTAADERKPLLQKRQTTYGSD